MTAVLGISAFYHDSAAALIIDGRIAFAAQEERFTRIKHDSSFPANAIESCLRESGLDPEKLDSVAFYEKPVLHFERLLETYLAYAPKGLRSFMQMMPRWLQKNLFIPREIDRGLGNSFAGPMYFIRHHDSHGASAFFPSPFDSAAVVTMDGVGEWTTTSWGVGRGNRIELKQEIRFPHSLGLLYSAFTYYTGFRVNTGEYKVMGLAPYGEPKYADLIHDHLIDIKEDGSFWIDQRYFDYCAGMTMTNDRFHRLFGAPPRNPESLLTQRDMDLAASIQRVTEDVVLKICRHVHKCTGEENLCLAGGVALNCVANGRILREGPFKKLWVQPASGDAGGALGASLFAWHQILGHPRNCEPGDSMRGAFLGPSFSNVSVASVLNALGAKYVQFSEEDTLCEEIARLLADGKVIGHFAGRAEFGPRALGNRSILGDPRSTSMQTIMNLKVKFRESFRPFAPSCMEEIANEYFDLETPSPYMLLVAPLRVERRQQMDDRQNALFGIEKLNISRSDLPAITHVDYSARIQTVNELVSPRYHKIIQAFRRLTGFGVVINTSFNIRGEPIVGSPTDAYRCFMYTDLDVLVVEDCICLKNEQSPMAGANDYKASFKLD